nr:IS5 family transposase [Wenjunlia vitaminophila]
MRRHELTDESWAVIGPLLAPPQMGRPVRDRRQVVNGILWKLSTGAAWRDLPERYGPWKTVYERFRRWSADGTWDRLLAHVQQHSDAVGGVDWSVVCVDSTTVRAHQHAAGPEKGALGRGDRPVRGGLTTKIHLPRRAGQALAFTLTAGNVNDCTHRSWPHPHRAVRARPPPTRPKLVAQGLLTKKIRAYLRGRGIKAAIPERIDQINGRIRRGESRCRLNRAAYRRRNVVERCFNRLKHNKALATRYDKRARHYQALVTLACLRLWLP